MTSTWTDTIRSDMAVHLGRVMRVDADGTPWVRLPDGSVTSARRTNTVGLDCLLAAVMNETPAVIVFDENDPDRPIIIGVIATQAVATEASTDVNARVDGRKVELTGQEEVTLRCGKASITLTKAGKIILRGAYLLSRSSGVNRIKGASVQIN